MGKLQQTTRRRVCFVTGTRAEFGLMRTALRAIQRHPRLKLQIIATGMHLDPAHGDGIAAIRRDGFAVHAVVPWPPDSGRSPATNALHTGQAIALLAAAFKRLRSDIILVTGDRVEAFAAAAAAHLSHRVVAHVHGGDRALGQVDDSLRHAITKLAHVHFAATTQSAQRIARLGEQPWRIRRIGSPGNDNIARSAASWRNITALAPRLAKRAYALLVLHPASPDADNERRRAERVLAATRQLKLPIVIVYPNNDPGSAGIIHAWRTHANDPDLLIHPDLPRATYLGLLKHAAVLVGNSSSGIIEAEAFGTPTLDIGPRQAGRERAANVLHSSYERDAIVKALRQAVRGRAKTPPRRVYAGRGAGRRIAATLATLPITPRLINKLIRY